MAGINVTVRVANATPGTGALATTYADDGVTTTTNPVVTDATGTFGFYIADGKYDLTYSGTGFTTKIIAAIEIADVTESGPGTGDSAWATGKLNSIRFVDGKQFATVQAAINDLPSTGGWVLVPPGTYVGPTTIPSHVHITGYVPGVTAATITAATNLVWGTPPADQKVIFTYTANLTISSLWNTTIEGITFDFGGGNFGIILQNSVFNNSFDITIQNCGTGAALTMSTDSAANHSVNSNRFPNLYIFNAGKGVLCNAASPNVVANNRFGYLFINNISTRAIEFQQNADTNSFDMTFIGGLGNTGQFIAFNTQTPGSDTGCNDNVFRHLITDVFTGGAYTGTAIQINKSFGNVIMAWSVGGGLTSGGGTELATSNSPSYSITYAVDFNTSVNNNTAIIGGNIYLNGTLRNYAGTTTMGKTLKKGTGAGNYTSISLAYVVVDGTNLALTVTIPTGWKLEVLVTGDICSNTAAVPVQVAIADGAAVVKETSITTITAGASINFALATVITGDGASHTVDLRYKTTNAADAAAIQNGSATFAPTMVFTLMPSN